MRTGMSPQEAAENVISRIKKKYPQNQAAVVVANINGEFGELCDSIIYDYDDNMIIFIL